MTARCALLVDSDKGFSDMLRGSLSAYGFQVVVATDWNDGLSMALNPDIIFVTVDLPDKAGFETCGRAKGAAMGIPVVLATATIPWAEMGLHQKTKLHADAYLDKRTLTREELIRKLDPLIDLGPARIDSPSVEPADLVPAGPGAGVAAQDDVRGAERPRASGAQVVSEPPGDERRPVAEFAASGLDAQAAALLAELDAATITDQPSGAGRESEPEPSGRVTELEQELDRLRWELDQTRRAATSSPFSGDFLRLSEVITAKGEEITLLKKELSGRDRQIATDKKTLRQFAARVVMALRERGEAFERASQLSGGLEAAQAEVGKLEGALQAIHQKHAEAQQAVEALTLALGQHEAARQRHELMLAGLQARHAAALERAEQQQVSALKVLETKLGEERHQVVAVLVAEWEGKLAELRHGHTEAVAALRREQQGHLTALQAAHQEDLVKRDGERGTDLRRAAEEQAAVRAEAEETRRRHELALSEIQARHAEALERAAENHRSDLRGLKTRLRDDRDQAVAVVVAEWEGKLEEQGRGHAEAVGALSREHQEKLAKMDGDHLAALRRASSELTNLRNGLTQRDKETRERFELTLAEVRARHAEALKQAERDRLSALKDRETRLGEEKDQAVAAVEREWKAKLNELRGEHAKAVTVLRREQQDQLAASQIVHQEELAKRDAEHEAALRQASSELTIVRTQMAQLQKDTRQRYQVSMAEVEARHAETLRQAKQDHLAALKAFETRLQEARDQAVAVVVGEWQGKQEDLRREYAEAVSALRKEHQNHRTAIQAAHQQEREKGNDEHQSALRQASSEVATLRSQMANLDKKARQRYEVVLAEVQSRSAEALETRLREERGQAVAAVEAEWRAKLEELRRGHANADTAVRTEQAIHQRELAKRDGEHQAALGQASTELATLRTGMAQLHNETRLRNEVTMAEVQVRSAQALKRAEADHLSALKALETRLREEKEQAAAAVEGEWEAKLEGVRRAHAETCAAERTEHQDRVAAIEAVRGDDLARRDGTVEVFDAQVPPTAASDSLKAAQARIELLDRELVKAKNQIAARNRVIEAHQRNLADQENTITSLEAVIRDTLR